MGKAITQLRIFFVLYFCVSLPVFTLRLRCKHRLSRAPVCQSKDDEPYWAQNWTKTKYLKHPTCMSQGCINAACMIISNMDPCADPCENFYDFACGKFIKYKIMPDDKSTINIPHSISDQLEAKISAILEDENRNNEVRAFKLAKKLYRNCMNLEDIEDNSVEYMKKYLDKLGGWPVLEDHWKEENFDWEEVTYKLHKLGFGSSYLFRLYIFLDPKNSSRTTIFIHQALLGLKREYLSHGLNDKLVRAYFNYMVDVAEIFGAKKQRALKELKKSLDFEITLAKISLPKEALRNFTKLYNPMKISQLQEKYPYFAWLRYINTMLGDPGIKSSEIVILQSPGYISSLEKLLTHTPRRILANYIFWRVVENSVSFLSNKLRKRLLDYSRTVSGTVALPPRWRECVAVVSNGMPVAIGALYIREHFDPESKAQAMEMVQNIRHVLQNILRGVEWMDWNTKKRALDKLKNMQSHVGYPDELLSNRIIDQFYMKLNMSNNYLESILEITKFERSFEARSLHAPVNKSGWVDHANAAVVNAFYTFSENSINLPAGILQGAFFSRNRPRYMNYGAIGTVIGHEIIHGYDDKGRQYDKDGNLVDWWLPPTEKSFIQRAQCFIDQYTSYTEPEVLLHLNGINTQGENMADNGGVKAAYLAYKDWAYNNGPEARLPGLDFAPEQLFWLSLANAFCTKSRPEYLKLMITTDEHSPAMFRVLGSLSNNPDFAKDFRCRPNSPMNPDKKCILW